MPERSKRIYFYDDEKLKNINKDNLELLRKYKVDMTLRELSQTTIKAYENDIKEWFIYILDNQFNQDIIKLTEDDITEFLYYCKTKGNNVARMTRRMSSISAFYRFLRKKRLIIISAIRSIFTTRRLSTGRNRRSGKHMTLSDPILSAVPESIFPILRSR